MREVYQSGSFIQPTNIKLLTTVVLLEILPNFLNLVFGTLFTKLTKLDMEINYQIFNKLVASI